MPFDDSDLKKMIEAQMNKNGLRFGNEGSLEVQDLIMRMLQPEVTQRWPIELILKHPWLGKPNLSDNRMSSISYVTTKLASNKNFDHSTEEQLEKRHETSIRI